MLRSERWHRDRPRGAEIASRYGVPLWYGSHEELLADDTIEAVSVTTAEHEHRDPVLTALAAGKHVLVEKPIASTLDDARAMLEASRASSAILMPGHVLRFAPTYAGVKAAVEGGELGRIVSMSARRNRQASLIASHGRVHPALVTAIHDIDIMLWSAGDGVRRVCAVDRLAGRDGGAHGLWGLLEFDSGVVARVKTSWLLPDGAEISTEDSFQVTGMLGTARVQLESPPLRIWGSGGSGASDVGYEPVVHGVTGGALGMEIAHFAQQALVGKPSPIVTPEDGVRALAVVLALIEAAETGESVTPQTVE